jgi:pimeloyl-ACP methyl ester carboxylesterase
MYLDISGSRIFTTSFGSGTRTFLGFGAWMFGGELWLPVCEILSRSWRACTFDQSGSGETQVPAEEITRDSLVDQVFAVMDGLGIERCVLGSESRGTLIALLAAVRRPERFDGLVLVNGTPVMPELAAFHAWHDTVRHDRAEWLRWFAEVSIVEPDSQHMRTWLEHMGSHAPLDQVIRAGEALMGINLLDQLQDVSVPTLIIAGGVDPGAPENGQELVSRIPRATLVILDGAGHGPTLTRPDAVARTMLDFFA